MHIYMNYVMCNNAYIYMYMYVNGSIGALSSQRSIRIYLFSNMHDVVFGQCAYIIIIIILLYIIGIFTHVRIARIWHDMKFYGWMTALLR